MPISLENYSRWATNHPTSEAAINKGAGSLEDASRQVGGFARFFSLQSAQNVRTAVMADFTRALSAEKARSPAFALCMVHSLLAYGYGTLYAPVELYMHCIR